MRLNMSQPKIIITDEEITYAEKILLGKNNVFNSERRAFIQNLETIDLQAVPGSGKTTALLAKLLILERYLPFEDGSGVLVISHTNAAIDEIKDRIQKHCPKLFSYPNYTGTIQGFVDQFMALPFYRSYMKGNLSTIDHDLYQEQIWKRFQGIYWDKAAGEPGKWLWGKHIKAAQQQAQIQSQVSDTCNLLIKREVMDWYFDYGDNILKSKSNKSAVLKDPENTKYQAIRSMFDNLVLKDGIVSFDYMYHFAELYIQASPIIKHLLQRRFHLIFVDEMQDMDKCQHDLLEQLFYDNGQSASIYQRIGDKNQAIFSGDVRLDDIWVGREKVLPITGSHRLSSTIANIVVPFGMPCMPIQGRNLQHNDLPPHVLVFDDNTILKVLPNYCELVAEYEKAGKLPRDRKYPIKAIAWRKGEDEKLGLKHYWPEYETHASKSKTEYPDFNSYILFAQKIYPENNRFKNNYKGILNAIVEVLCLEQIKNSDSKNGHFSVSSIQKYLKENHVDFYERFRIQLFQWCRDICLGKINDTIPAIKNLIPEILGCFGKSIEKSCNFINDEHTQTVGSPGSSTDIKPKDNIYRCNNTGIEVEVGTVHSVKGQTHTATLYLESDYQGDYEINRLKHCFQCSNHNFSTEPNKDVYKKQSLRMVYVGFSRPTHLLCFAVHKDRFEEKVFTDNGWKICKAWQEQEVSAITNNSGGSA